MDIELPTKRPKNTLYAYMKAKCFKCSVSLLISEIVTTDREVVVWENISWKRIGFSVYTRVTMNIVSIKDKHHSWQRWKYTV